MEQMQAAYVYHWNLDPFVLDRFISSTEVATFSEAVAQDDRKE